MHRFKTVINDKGLLLGYSTRGEGIVASDPFDGFSVCHYCGDSEKHYSKCKKELADFLAVEPSRIVVPTQQHTAKVAILKSLEFSQDEINGVDAVVTNIPELCIGVSTADCLPIIIFDTEAKAVGAIHAGWRGALAGIIQNGVRALTELGAKNIHAYIGPAISLEQFEVGEEVASLFPRHFVSRKFGQKPHVDLPAYAESVLSGCGVAEVIASRLCTKSNPNLFFSARNLGSNSGRNFTFTMLK